MRGHVSRYLAKALLLLLHAHVAGQLATAAEPVEFDAQHWISQLTADRFADRERASKELEALGVEAIQSLKTLESKSENPEARKRARIILERIERNSRIASPPFDWRRVKPIIKKSGRLSKNERWTADHSYQVTADLTIANEASLEIEPGSIVLLDDGVNVEIEGPRGRVVVGSDAKVKDPTVFLAASQQTRTPGHWGRFVARGAAHFKNTEFRGSSGLVIKSNSVLLNQVAILDTAGDAITYTDVKHVAHEDITIRNASGTGCVAIDDHPLIKRLKIIGTKTGVYVSGGGFSAEDVQIELVENAFQFEKQSYGMLRDVTIQECRGCGISIVDRSYPMFIGLRMKEIAGDGVSVSNASYPLLKNLDIEQVKGEAVRLSPNSRLLQP